MSLTQFWQGNIFHYYYYFCTYCWFFNMGKPVARLNHGLPAEHSHFPQHLERAYSFLGFEPVTWSSLMP